MKKAHTDKEIIQAASLKEINPEYIKENKADVAVDLDDSHGITHTYVVTFKKDGNQWLPLQVSELSSL